jgi:hypothetical protein
MMSTRPKQTLSSEFRAAYDTSYRASADDTDADVVKARKKLRTVKKKMTTKLRDLGEICQASTIVSSKHKSLISVRDHACGVYGLVQRDLFLLQREMDRTRRSRRT